MINCREAARLISRSMDQPLTWREKLALRFHWMMCDWCRRYRAQLLWLDQALKISFPGQPVNKL